MDKYTETLHLNTGSNKSLFLSAIRMKYMDKPVCFVCKKAISKEKAEINKEVYLPVCSKCKDTVKEKKMVKEYLDSLAEGFICGCI